MQIGFINFSQEELARKNKVLQIIHTPTAIDELGLGRIRDAFANLMFPGMSTLQRRAKYFAVMPSLFYQATKKNYGNNGTRRDVRAQVIKWEIRLTRMLFNGTTGDKTGITGSEMLEAAEKDPTKFVKYDPAYIYMSGLRTYGMIKGRGDIYTLILNRSKTNSEQAQKYKSGKAEEASDSEDLHGAEQMFSTCGEVYDFDNGEELSLSLTKEEALFIKKQITEITENKACKDSMLAYILDKNLPVASEYDSLEAIWEDTSEDFAKHKRVYLMGLLFSRLAHIIHLRFNHIAATFNEDEDEVAKLQTEIEALSEGLNSDEVGKMLNSIQVQGKVTDSKVIEFCGTAAKLIESGQWGELDELIVKRENAVKPGRTKLRNPKYKGEKRDWPHKYSFRWNEIVYRVITEIREGEQRG